jgi:hypothetical protein
VGVGLPLPPLTATVTESAWAVVMLDEDGVTVTIGVDLVMVTGALLVPHAAMHKLRAIPIQAAAFFCKLLIPML